MPSGPVPKRTDQRRRRNKPEGVQVSKAKAGAPLKWPNARSDWHPMAADLYRAIRVSGMVQFYEQTDVQEALIQCELMSRELKKGQRVSSQMVTAILSRLDSLGTTEGARRRARIELERGPVPEEAPGVAIMARYRQAAASAK